MVVALALTSDAMAAGSEALRVAVVFPPAEQHLAWAAAQQLQQAGRHAGLEIGIEPAALVDSTAPLPDLLVMPVRSLATQVPELQVLELPFFYPTPAAVHRQLEGELGDYLVAKARQRGWQILAWWDDGMHVFSGLKRYDRVRNFKAREFLLTRPDPVAEKQFRYWKASARRIHPQDSEMVLSECLIANRGATLQEIVREQLYRVHLAISLTDHRYEGWVVIAPGQRWAQLDTATRKKLRAALRTTTDWQRSDASERASAALARLKQLGMTIYAVDSSEREAFREVLPDWTVLLPDELGAEEKRKLIRLASTGAAVVVGAGVVAPGEERPDPAPATQTRQRDQGRR